MRNGWRICFQDGREYVAWSFTIEGFVLSRHFIDDGAQSENVRAAIDYFPPRLLGRHITGGAEHHARPRAHLLSRRLGRNDRRRLFSQFRQTEIENFHVAIRPQHDVLGLDIAMNDSRCMSGCQSVGNLNRDLQRLVEIQSGMRQPLP